MAYVIAEPCVDVLDQSCVAVCPVDCIHFEEGTDRKLFIDPDECIDCAVCVPECPVNAIYYEQEVPEDQREFVAINRELSQTWPNLTRKINQLPDADNWAKILPKKQHLDRG
jgi:ferredoxin